MRKKENIFWKAPFFMVMVFACALVLFGCKTTESAKGGDSSTPAADKASSSGDTAPQPILTDTVPKVGGPKRTVAVGKFDAIGAFRQKYGDWDIGGGMSAMLVTALKESGQFIILERANIGQILSEQQMKGQKLVHQGSGPSLGKIIGVNLMIYGSITEFGDEDKGGGISLGASGGGMGNLLSGAFSRQTSSGKVTMDIRIVDTTTSEVLDVYKVEEKVDNSGWDLSLGYQGINFGTNQFMKTPLGQAARKAISRAVQLIAAKANMTPWSAQVVEWDGKDVYINAGSGAGLKVGDKFMVATIVKRLTDPQTGQLLSVRKRELGIVQITGVESKMAFGSFTPLGIDAPQRGDLVVPFGK